MGREFELLKAALEGHARISLVSISGNPPDSCTVEYRIRSLAPAAELGGNAGTVTRFTHIAQFFLLPGFPRDAPRCRFLTPVFHPNIAGNFTNLCEDWHPDDSLPELIKRIGRALAFEEYDLARVINKEAAAWVQAHLTELPLDHPDGPSTDLMGQAPDAGQARQSHAQNGGLQAQFASGPGPEARPAGPPPTKFPDHAFDRPTPPPASDDDDRIRPKKVPSRMGPALELGTGMPVAPPVFNFGQTPESDLPRSVPHDATEAYRQAEASDENDATVAYVPPSQVLGRLVDTVTGTPYQITAAATTLGRGARNTLVIDDKSVSRVHCRIEHNPNGFRIVDISSTNGTFVNEERISGRALHGGDKIRMGAVVLIFESA